MADSILTRLTKEVTPLIDHDTVTFVWKGRSAPELVGDITGWEDGSSIKLEKQGRGLWTYQQTFPLDAYIEYGFVNDGESLDDPLNPRQTSNGVGGTNNYFSMPGYKPTGLARYVKHVAHGALSRFSLPTDYLIFGDRRSVHFYQPPVSDPVPLLVVWDGQDYLKRARLNIIVDNLIAQGSIQPIAMVFVNNGGERSRSIEYSPSEATLVWLMSQVMPLAKRKLHLVDSEVNPGQYGVLGASMGGLMAMYTGLRMPQVFGKVLSQSGAFSLGSIDSVVYDLLQHGEKRPLTIWMDAGKFDLAGLLEANRKMNSVLTQLGYPVAYHEYSAGHNYPSWKDDIARGLETLYGVNK